MFLFEGSDFLNAVLNWFFAWTASFCFLSDYQNGITDYECGDLVVNALCCVCARSTFYLKVICSAIIFLVFSIMTGAYTYTFSVRPPTRSRWFNLILSRQMSSGGRIIADICPSTPDPSWCECIPYQFRWRRESAGSARVDAKLFNRLCPSRRGCFALNSDHVTGTAKSLCQTNC